MEPLSRFPALIMISQSCPRAYLFLSASYRGRCSSSFYRDLTLPIHLVASTRLRSFHASSRKQLARPTKGNFASSKDSWRKAIKPQSSQTSNRSEPSEDAKPPREQHALSQSQTTPSSPANAINDKLFADPLNPPISTLPPLLQTPREEDFDAKWRYWLASGKAYVTFYKSALRQLWNNWKLLRKLSQKPELIRSLELKRETPPPIFSRQHDLIARSPPQLHGEIDFNLPYSLKNGRLVLLEGSKDFSQLKSLPIGHVVSEKESRQQERRVGAATREDYSRSEYQFMLRTRRDIKKMIPFGLMLVLLGEWTPLVVLFVNSIVPRVCWIPSQEKKRLEKQERSRHESHRHDRNAFIMIMRGQGSAGSLNAADFVFRRLSHELLYTTENWLRQTPMLSDLIQRIDRRLVLRKMRYLDIDDALITRHGGAKSMSAAEVRLAAAERGMNVLGKDEHVIRRALDRWVHAGGWRSILEHSKKLDTPKAQI